ncbi:cation:proton antiporter regulatory subunit [Ilumatobacter sp.]|uniref:cation:proton antiporter regulatory subunit n=1 Tax=Ilumatobacter sp. TaxID=1967498 RepID=UPI003AF4664D
MSEVLETRLPGVGVRHEFDTETGQRVGVIVHRDGRREVVVYGHDDPDACSTVLDLTAESARTIAELLGASQVSETVAAVQYDIEGLAIEWIQIPETSPAIDKTIREGEYRTRTGASIVAVARSDLSVPAPDPEFTLQGGDVAVAVGTVEGLAALRELLAP